MTGFSGVNLGNWLVLEKWMSRGLFAGVEAEDEWYLSHRLDPALLRERLTQHRESFVTARDFAYLAARGVSVLRLPVPYFVFGDVPPFLGCIDAVDRAFRWAERYGLQILLDLHTVPESQNGFDNGGITGVCKFHTDPAYSRTALSVLERLAARYGSHPSLWGIEVLNEPISQQLWDLLDVPHRYPAIDPQRAADSSGVPTDFLTEYYREAYAVIRSKSPGARVVFHDGFRMPEWFGVLDTGEFANFAVDTHQYVMMAGQRDLDGYLDYIAHTFGDSIRTASAHFPVFVGEWCLDTKSAGLRDMEAAERRHYNQRIAAAHLEAFEPAIGWTYWAWRIDDDDEILDTWDFLRSVEAGYLPASPGQRAGVAGEERA